MKWRAFLGRSHCQRKTVKKQASGIALSTAKKKNKKGTLLCMSEKLEATEK